jgi:hypothetical protein
VNARRLTLLSLSPAEGRKLGVSGLSVPFPAGLGVRVGGVLRLRTRMGSLRLGLRGRTCRMGARSRSTARVRPRLSSRGVVRVGLRRLTRGFGRRHSTVRMRRDDRSLGDTVQVGTALDRMPSPLRYVIQAATAR